LARAASGRAHSLAAAAMRALARARAALLHSRASAEAAPRAPLAAPAVSAFTRARGASTAPAARGSPLVFVGAGTNLARADKARSEDAFFIRARALGVADGISAWAELGVDSGAYARALMAAVAAEVAAAERAAGAPPDPAAALRAAHRSVREQGSSTACVAVARADGVLRVVNVGDSGLAVWRRARPPPGAAAPPLRLAEAARLWELVGDVPASSFGFNSPRQLAASRHHSHAVSDGAVVDFALRGGELVIAATDGVLDNLAPADVAAVLSRFDFEPCAALARMARARFAAAVAAARAADGRGPPPVPRALRAHPNTAPEDVTDGAFAAKRADCEAQLRGMSAAVAFAAQRVGGDKKAATPWAAAAAAQGLNMRGGKPDDATAVCALVIVDDAAVDAARSAWGEAEAEA